MSIQVQWRRGNNSQIAAFTGADGEITVNTTNYTLNIHDGSTAGGFPLVGTTATQSLSNKTLSGNTTVSGNLIPGANVTYSLGTSTARFKDLWLAGNTIYLDNANISVVNGNIVFYNATGPAIDIATILLGSNTSLISANLGAFQTYANTKIGTNTNSNLVVVATTTSTSTTTGALVVGGGMGISGNIFTAGWIVPTSNISQNLGTTTQWWNTFYGVSTQARYADLAENYQADDNYEPGTVLVFGGSNEVTISSIADDTAVAGVVSTNPAHLMNGALTGTNVVPLALQGRVPCKVQGPVEKGTVLVTSQNPGIAKAIDYSLYRPGVILGKALEYIQDNSIRTIEIVVGRF